MKKFLDIDDMGALPNMRHAEVQDLPPQTRELIESLRAGGTFVIWNKKTPVAVLVILPATPTVGEESLRQLYDYLIRAAPPAKGAKKQPPRRGSRR